MRSESKKYALPIIIQTSCSRGVRRIFFESRFQFQNQTSRPLSANITNCSNGTIVNNGNNSFLEFESIPVCDFIPFEELNCEIWNKYFKIKIAPKQESRKPICLARVPNDVSDWGIVSSHEIQSDPSSIRFVVTEMNENQPPRLGLEMRFFFKSVL